MSGQDQVMRVGLIGLGAVAEAHLAGASSAHGVAVVAGADINPERRASMAARWGIRTYPDAVELLDAERLDIACVVTPAATHRELTRLAAERRVHVLCEKPMAVSLEDAEAMVESCNRLEVKLFYGSTYRFLPAVREAKRLITDGAIGDVVLLAESIVGGCGVEGWREFGPHHYPAGGPGGGGMGLVDHGVHLVDVFRWLTASEVETVVGRGNISGGAPSTEFLTMVFSSGAVGQLLYNEVTHASDLPWEGLFSWGGRWASDGTIVAGGGWDCHPLSIRVHGTHGALRIFPYANHLFHLTASSTREVPLDGPPMPGNFTRQIESFSDSVRRNLAPEVTGEDGLRALSVILAAYESFSRRCFASPGRGSAREGNGEH